MADSILTDTKTMLGVLEENTTFDPELILHINSVFPDLNQLGVGPDEGFAISGSTETWEDFLEDDLLLNNVKGYMFLRAKQFFDPNQNGALQTAIQNSIEKTEWRIRVYMDELRG